MIFRSPLAWIGLVGLAACAPVYSTGAHPTGETLPARSSASKEPSAGPAETGRLAELLGKLVWPLATDRLTVLSSPYGDRNHPTARERRFHGGLDLRAPAGTPVYASADGVVVESALAGAYGNRVVIDHGAGLRSLYAHHSRNLVASGQRVRRGQVIATVGRTGNATGDHLHFELRWRDGTVDPWIVLPPLGAGRGR